jgi:hypothetical protein
MADAGQEEAQMRRGLRGENHIEDGQTPSKERRPEAHRNGGSMARVESDRCGGG